METRRGCPSTALQGKAARVCQLEASLAHLPQLPGPSAPSSSALLLGEEPQRWLGGEPSVPPAGRGAMLWDRGLEVPALSTLTWKEVQMLPGGGLACARF